MSLSNKEFEYLKNLEKTFTEDSKIVLSKGKRNREIKSIDLKEKFLLDYYKGNISYKYTYNKRWKNDVVLFRYDTGVPHTNPDGTLIAGPHVHIFREGYSMKYAIPASDIGILKTDDIQIILTKILNQRNVIKIPTIVPSLL